MMSFRSLGPALLACTLLLSGCDSAEERAETHYQRAQALLAENDVERAIIEFRNVFKLDGNHIVARQAYAALLKEQGANREALAQYMLLTEQDPQNASAHRDLTELALQQQDFDTAGLHAARAFDLAPDDPMVRALKATVDYRKGENPEAAVEMARAVLDEAPDNIPAHMLVITERLAQGDQSGALARIDTALERVPDDEGLHLIRLSTLERMGDIPAVGAQLERMTAKFPDNDGIRQALVQYHLRASDLDAAEAVLRESAGRDPENPDPTLNVVQFLYEMRGAAAARAELERLIAGSKAPYPFQRALAALDFAEGDAETAISTLRDLLEDETLEPEAENALQISLAEMLDEIGAAAESADLVAGILSRDPDHVEALKLRARQAISDDRPEAAITDMRTALAQAPRDPEIMTIMAFAHEREGARELMGERLALAVEASSHGAEEALRYANFLMQEDRIGPAEAVVVNALRRAPSHPKLLNMLGRIHLEREDWVRAERVARLLQETGDPVTAAMANALRTQSLQRQGRTEENLALLADLAESSDGDARAMTDLVRTQVAAGETEAARDYLNGVLGEDPGNMPARFLLAGIAATEGDLEDAEARYRAIVAEAPGLASGYQALFAILAAQGQIEEAESVLQTGIETAEQTDRLLFTKAGILEARGEIAGAIDIYQTLYARDDRSLVLANNLASLMTIGGAETPQADLERAFSIARRLRNSDVPYFQDTYGWILYLRGDHIQAVDYLTAAAGALSQTAQVQFHLGEALLALGRRDEARTAYENALTAADQGSTLPQRARVEARLEEVGARNPDGADSEAPAPQN